MHRTIIFIILSLLFSCVDCCGDTFTNSKTSQVLHGYATGKNVRNETVVYTVEKGIQRLNLAEYNIKYNSHGRDNKVVVIDIDAPIELEAEADAIEKIISTAADKGPLFILLTLDAAGGDPLITKRICAAITNTKHCPIYSFIRGGKTNGLYAAATMLAFACEKIYIAPQASFGAATSDKITDGDVNKINIDYVKRFGESVGEKLASAYRAYTAALAEGNNRPPLLAMAMVDKNIEVVEVADIFDNLKPAEKNSPTPATTFIEPINIKATQSIRQTWKKKGSLLTLSAEQALKCKIADRIVPSQNQLLKILGADSAEIVYENSHIKVRQNFNQTKKRFNKLISDITTLEKSLITVRVKRQKLKILSKLIRNYKQALDLAEQNPDLNYDTLSLKTQMNTARGKYQEIKASR